MIRPQYLDFMPCPHCKNDGNPDVCEKYFYDSNYEPMDEAEEDND
jgi:hypothetical protein